MTNSTNNVQKFQFGIFEITKDYEKATVLITRPSKGKYDLGFKYVHHYSYRIYKPEVRAEKMDAFVAKFIEEQTARQIEKENKVAALKAARTNFKNPFTLGQVLYRSWGYEQTNINFFEVVEVKAKSIVVREISQERKETGWCQGTCMPITGSFEGDPVTKIVQVRVHNDIPNYSVSDLSVWNVQPKHWSSYH